jgi:asparagine synthase (glutamine-hydrolysing)
MCGIAGYVEDSTHAAAPGLLEQMCDTIQHRGPDGFGYFRKGPVALGHRRLSIIDLSGGAQPLGNEDDRVQVVFNGEIYNYLELREDLVKKGHRFRTKSDTEVLVHLYEEVGEQMPEHLNGMFALAIWDGRKKELFLARDPFGKKPLYYSTEIPGFQVAFASELKAFAPIPAFDPDVNSRAVADYLAFGYIADPDTIYRKVAKLPPGHSLLLSAGKTRTRRYWEPRFDIEEDMNYAAAARECFELAADSVARRMISDVPLGGFLSGGVDSSAVVAMMAQRSTQKVKSFSIGFTIATWDEVEYARMVAKRYDTDHYERVVTPSVEEMLPVLAHHYDEPFSDSSAIPTLYLSRMTREHVTVALSGDGGDELFGGYRRYQFALYEERLRSRLPAWLRRSVLRPVANAYPKFDYLPRPFRAKATLEGISNDLAESYFEAMTGFRFGLYDHILSPELKQALGGYSPRRRFIERFRRHSHLPPLQQLEAVDFETYLPGDILVKVDRASMAYSLETRSPWLDRRLGALSCRMPASFKIRNGVGKYIFKDIFKPHVPETILTRPKMGFGVPMDNWMRTSLKPVFESVVLRPEAEQYVSLPKVRAIWQTHQSGARNYSRELWSLLALMCWHDRYQTRQPGQALAAAIG